MNVYGYAEEKTKLSNRLKRIGGQVRGVEKMIQDDVYCIDILTQITASQAALDKVALELLRGHAAHCLTNDSVMPTGKDNKVDELINAIGRMI